MLAESTEVIASQVFGAGLAAMQAQCSATVIAAGEAFFRGL